jgi:hypothetical protein
MIPFSTGEADVGLILVTSGGETGLVYEYAIV